MDYERSTDEDSDNEENWLDTNWDSGPSYSNEHAGRTQNTSPAVTSSADSYNGAAGMSGQDSSGSGSAPLMTRMQLNDHKAGMQGLDKEHINQIIYEASKGSKFFENERRKEEQVKLRIQEQEKNRKKITEFEIQRGLQEADALVAQLEASRDLSQSIVHVDMDAFYAAVEMREDPSLRDKPMAVGGMGMLSTSNYEARKYGVRAAMPGFIGRKLCPQLILVRPSYAKYQEVSTQVREVLSEYDPNFNPMSLDEAYLNFTSHLAHRQSTTVQERSFLKRCESMVEASLCFCDLNETLRDAVVFGEALPSESVNSKLSASGTAAVPDAEVAKGNLTASPRKLFKNSPSKPALSLELPLEGGSYAKNFVTDVLKVTRDSAPEPLVCTVSSECDEKEGILKFKPCRIGSACHICGKPVPAYEVVTFGLDLESAVQEMRCRIEQRTRLTASAGIAPNKMLAKVCSDQNKPNGQFYLPPDLNKVREFVERLPIRKISGIGRVTEQLLGALGIVTCTDLYKQRALLYHLYSSVSFNHFMRIACGIGSVQVASHEERKSMSTERTFRELSRPEELYSKCLDLCNSLAADLAEEHIVGKTISLKLKTTDFQVRTRAQTVSNFTNDADTIFAVAKAILHAEIQAELPKPLRLRLMGVRMSKLASVGEGLREKQDTIKGFLSKVKTSPHSARSPVKAEVSIQDSRSLAAAVPSAAPPATSFPAIGSSVQDKADGRKAVVDVIVADESRTIHETSSQNLFVNSGNIVDAKDDEDRKNRGGVTDFIIQSETGNGDNVTDEEDLVQELIQEKRKFGGENSSEDMKRRNSSSQRKVDMNQNEEDREQEKADSAYKAAKDVNINFADDRSTSSKLIASESEPTSMRKLGHAAGGTSSPSSPSVSEMHTGSNYSTPAFTPNNITNEIPQDVASASYDDISSMFVREPTYTCPVCCKAISCVNLTDFNAHIDLCLQGGMVQPPPKQASDRQGKHQNTSSSSKKTKRPSGSDARSKASKKSTQVSVHNPSVVGVSSQPNQTQSKEKTMTKACSVAQDGARNQELGNISKGQNVDCSIPSSNQVQTSSVEDALEPVEYMVCPLCGAERADWTLESFNHHVDACLNRDTISQILREQRGNEEQPKKRQAGSSPEELKGSHAGGKRPKKSSDKKSGQSILSFFKS